jgi:KDO2-lipid IV(A) lauroyltransferase
MNYYIQYLFVVFFANVAKLFPRKKFLALGRVLGRFAFYILKSRADLATKNIQKTIEPDFDRARRIALKSFEHFALVSFELLLSLVNKLDWQTLMSRFVDSDEIIAKIKRYHEASNGRVIFITAHIGNWEIIGKYIGANGIDLGVVGRDINNPLINKMVIESRNQFGNTMIEKGGAMLPLAKILKSNRAVALLPDQKINDSNSAKIDFLGVPAGTALSVAKLAIRFEAPIIPVAAVTVDDFKYKLILGNVIQVAKTDDEIKITRQMNDELGCFIKAYPEQWFWMHNRWKD